MNKGAIKKYAVWARRELISRVSQRAALYDIEEEGYGDPAVDSVRGKVLTGAEKRQRKALIGQIKEKGYEEVMEEVAYTWFNRFCALRFMEVNGYLPTHVRVFTDDDNEFKPQILVEAINMELDGLDMERVYALKSGNENDELFKYLVITQCNALNGILPGMFQRIEDYTELLFPDNLLREGSVAEQMVRLIPEEDWKDQVQIIGWLYQYYNSEKKDQVFAALKNKKVKITKENIPAATQLFTPDWIVRYMVENSLGRLWVEGHPNEELKGKWRYYLEEAKQEPEVERQLEEIRKEYGALNPEDLRCIDPCMGSGHILCYMFDVLLQIYQAHGVQTRDAVRSIVENNLYGLDIDDRAAQLAYFSVMMKGRQYDSRFFRRGVQPHVYAIVESNYVDKFAVEYFCNGNTKLKIAMDTILNELRDAKEYGSTLIMTFQDWSIFHQRFAEIMEDISISRETILRELLPLVQVAEILTQKYNVVITNPPYMGSSGMNAKLSAFLKRNYPDSKSDLFAVFVECCNKMSIVKGYQAMITQHAWMFLSGFEKLRKMINNSIVVNMIHLGARAFDEIGGEVVQTTSFVLHKNSNAEYIGTYIRLLEPNTQQRKEKLFLSGECRYYTKQKLFSNIPGNVYAYWLSPRIINIFAHEKTLSFFGKTRKGLSTSDNNRFIRFWYEVSFEKVKFNCRCPADTYSNNYKWYPYIHGGVYRKWYPNFDSVVNFANDAKEMKDTVMKKYSYLNSPDFVIKKTDIYFKPGIVWNDMADVFNAKYMEEGYIFSDVTPSYIPQKHFFSVLAYFNSNSFSAIAKVVSQGMHYSTGHIPKIPYIPVSDETDKKITQYVRENIHLVKNSEISVETSWDFKKHPLVYYKILSYEKNNADKGNHSGDINYIQVAFIKWSKECSDHYDQLKSNEEELNRIFLDIYRLQNELSPKVDNKDISVRKADLNRDIRSLISYAVGCMFGRYSLDVEGLAYAGGEWDASKYITFQLVKDAILPICDDDYFENDITGRFVEWVEIVYGTDILEENLKFIAYALGGKGNSREVIRNYFLNDFYANHCQVYQKRPIYWLFDSGKKGGFKCLIYMHRYRPDTIARIRTDYVHEQQSRYRTEVQNLEQRIASAATSERVKLNKQLKKLQDQERELYDYEEKIHHLADQMISIDLDDGVKKNYAIFQDVLAKIK